MKEPIFTGSGVAIITPFHHEALDLETLGQLIDAQVENGTDAVAVCTATGEVTTLSYRERMRCIEFCVEYTNGRVPVIAGVGAESTERAAILSRDTQSAGADGLLVSAPCYSRPTQNGLIRHFKVIADVVNIPLILNCEPERTGVCLAPESCAILSRHPSIIGAVDASENLGLLRQARNLCPEDFSFWSGRDEQAVSACVLGGVGVISVAANLLPSELHVLTRLCLDNDFQSAGQLLLQLQPFFDMLMCETDPIPVKTALSLLEFGTGDLRPPLCLPTAEHLEFILETLLKYGLAPSL